MIRELPFWLALSTLLFVAACAAPARLPAVPEAREADAVVDGMTGIRYWQAADLSVMEEDGLEAYRREAALEAASGAKEPLAPASYLAISGGGENGAFGAGLLVGWTAAGTRPAFKLVTGVSTGALTAPFAFLGPAYDGDLKAVYTTISGADVLEKRGLVAALFDDALADNSPLKRLVARYVTADLLKAIAAENAKGRLLLIGTTNLDAAKPVIWNIGKIAASGSPHALDLVREILVASAAIPGAFPPVMIDVGLDGKAYQEMHVDGGVSAQVFVYPPSFDFAEMARKGDIVRQRHLYVIRNSRLVADWKEVGRQTLPIVNRSIASLIRTQGVGDLYRIYATALRDGVDFNLAYIPADFTVPLPEPFDRNYMNALFERGYAMAKAGYPWEEAPPGY